MKAFLYGFCSVMSTHISLPKLSEEKKYMLGEVAALTLLLFTVFSALMFLVVLTGWKITN